MSSRALRTAGAVDAVTVDAFFTLAVALAVQAGADPARAGALMGELAAIFVNARAVAFARGAASVREQQQPSSYLHRAMVWIVFGRQADDTGGRGRHTYPRRRVRRPVVSDAEVATIVALLALAGLVVLETWFLWGGIAAR